VQLDLYSNDSAQRESMGRAAKIALSGFQGAMGGTVVGVLLFDNEANFYEPEARRFRKMLDFRVIHYT
jgi:hypothetical protein